MQPSSPHLPCSALKATSGLRSERTCGILRFTSTGVTWKPARRSASEQASPVERLTSRSADQPPIRTATWVKRGSRSGMVGALRRNPNTLDLPVELDAGLVLYAMADGLAQFFDLCRGGA